MLTRRLAAAIGLIVAVVGSQLPEFVQQYRQRLGGAIDELQSIVSTFDAEAARQSLDRSAAIARLKSNSDALAQDHGNDLDYTIGRLARLERQAQAFVVSSPGGQILVMAEDLDPGIAARAYAAYQPAVPLTSAGLLAGLAGLVIGWALTHATAWPLRRLWGRRRVPALDRPLGIGEKPR